MDQAYSSDYETIYIYTKNDSTSTAIVDYKFNEDFNNSQNAAESMEIEYESKLFEKFEKEVDLVDLNNVKYEEEEIQINDVADDQNSSSEISNATTTSSSDESTESNTKQRSKSPTEGDFHCNICSIAFTTSSNRSRHYRSRKHIDLAKQIPKIEQKSTEQPQKIHKQRKIKLFKCQFCPKIFTTNSNWRRHENLHANGKTHECEKCGKKFMQKEYLRKHMVVHADVEIKIKLSEARRARLQYQNFVE